MASSESKPDEDEIDSSWDDDEDVDSGWEDGDSVDSVDAGRDREPGDAPESSVRPRRPLTAEEREARAARAAAKKERHRAKAAEKSERQKARAAAASAKQKGKSGKRRSVSPRATATNGTPRPAEERRAAAGPVARADVTRGASTTAATARRRGVPPLVVIVLLLVVAAGAIGLLIGRR